MPTVQSSSVDLDAANQSADHLAEVTVTVETDDGAEHRVVFARDDARDVETDPDSGVDSLYLVDLITEYAAFSRENAAACADAFDAAVDELDRRVAELNDARVQQFEYTLDTAPYELRAATHAPQQQMSAADMPRPTAPDGYQFLRESCVERQHAEEHEFHLELSDGRRYVVGIDAEQGCISDAKATNGEPTAETITGLFDAIRAVQVAMINRGVDLDPSMHIELYHSTA